MKRADEGWTKDMSRRSCPRCKGQQKLFRIAGTGHCMQCSKQWVFKDLNNKSDDQSSEDKTEEGQKKQGRCMTREVGPSMPCQSAKAEAIERSSRTSHE